MRINDTRPASHTIMASEKCFFLYLGIWNGNGLMHEGRGWIGWLVYCMCDMTHFTECYNAHEQRSKEQRATIVDRTSKRNWRLRVLVSFAIIYINAVIIRIGDMYNHAKINVHAVTPLLRISKRSTLR